VTKGYTDQLGAFRYKGHTIDAHVVRPKSAGRKGLSERTSGVWSIRIGTDQFAAFRASPDDTEHEVRERVKQWIDEHFPG
jgi:hypothetical protein